MGRGHFTSRIVQRNDDVAVNGGPGLLKLGSFSYLRTTDVPVRRIGAVVREHSQHQTRAGQACYPYLYFEIG